MDTLSRDFRQALRWLAGHPGFSAVAISTLALAVGFSTALFSVVNAVLLRPLPFAHPDQLVMVWEKSPHGNDRNSVSPADAFAWRERTRTLSDLATVAIDRVTLTGSGWEAQELPTQDVTGNVFTLLGVGAEIGRTFAPQESVDGAAPVALISDGLWRRRFAANRAIVGQSVDIDSKPTTIIGVMPPAFSLLNARADIWLPKVLHAGEQGRYLSVIGRLRPGVSIQQASTEFKAIAGQLAKETPQYNAEWSTTIVTMQEQLVGDVRRTLLVTFAAVLVLLAIAYFNIGNLLLNRAVARRREIGLRLALGATRGRLVQQFLAESTCLGVAGCLLALVVAGAIRVALGHLVPQGLPLPRLDEVTVDVRVVGFLLLTSLLATALFAVLPAWTFSGRDMAAAAAGTDRGSTAGRRQRWMRSILVAGEVALALVLLVSAGLLVRTMQRLDRVDLGIQPDNVLAFRVSLPSSRYEEEVRQREFYSDLLGRLDAIPSVRAAGAVRFLPLTGETTASTFWLLDAPRPKPGDEPVSDIRIVGGRYFDALRIPLRQGRLFGPTDNENSPDVIVINQALADRYWPGADAIGKRIDVPWGKTVNGKDVPIDFVFTVIGVVGNDREESLAQAGAPAMYWWYRQHAEGEMNFVVRTSADPATIEPSARAAVRDLDAGLAVADFRLMSSVVARSLARPRTTLTVLGTFAAVALLLAALGLYGVVAYWVSNRAREIGVRIALGAQRRDVIRLVVWQALSPAIAGVIIGLVIVLLVTRAMSSLLYGVSPTDPPTLLTLAGFLCLIAVAAGFLPGLRAARVDPARTLQSE